MNKYKVIEDGTIRFVVPYNYNQLSDHRLLFDIKNKILSFNVDYIKLSKKIWNMRIVNG